MEPVLWLKAASDKLKKPDNRSRKEVYNRYIDNSQRLLRSVSVWVLDPTPLPFPYQQTHSRVCLHLHTQHINEKYLQLHHFAWHIKNSIGVCVGACTGFPSIKLDLTNGYQGYCIQGIVWAQVSGVQGLF